MYVIYVIYVVYIVRTAEGKGKHCKYWLLWKRGSQWQEPTASLVYLKKCNTKTGKAGLNCLRISGRFGTSLISRWKSLPPCLGHSREMATTITICFEMFWVWAWLCGRHKALEGSQKGATGLNTCFFWHQEMPLKHVKHVETSWNGRGEHKRNALLLQDASDFDVRMSRLGNSPGLCVSEALIIVHQHRCRELL